MRKKKPYIHFHIVSLFPEAFGSYLASSIIGRAVENGSIAVSYYNPRDFTDDKNRRIDRKPYGGGPGMVIEPAPVIAAIEKARGRKKSVKIIFFSTNGKQFTSTLARSWSKKYEHIICIAGHYEGIDTRVKKAVQAEDITVGPFVLTGGELPALICIDAMTRHVGGVLGNEISLEENRTARADVYTRPPALTHRGKVYRVPSILRSGHHKKIDAWKEKKRTKT